MTTHRNTGRLDKGKLVTPTGIWQLAGSNRDDVVKQGDGLLSTAFEAGFILLEWDENETPR
jgi:hypothetical protein